MEDKLTICSVFHSPSNKALLELNRYLTSKLNPVNNYRWALANNALSANDGAEDVIADGKHITISGSEVPPAPLKWTRFSYHHAAALNKLRDYVKTRFLLILDPDFYMVRPGWINEIMDYMDTRGIAFFGVPWHPRHKNKIRYSLAPHALFADLKKADIGNFDFMPQCDNYRAKEISVAARVYDKLLSVFLGDRRFIGITKDTGHKLFELYKNNKELRYECVQPVFKPEFNLFDFLLPDRWSFTPKRAGFYTTSSFRDAGLFDAYSMGWEEFFWKGAPLGFHIRGGSGKFRDDLDYKITFLKEVLAGFIK